MGVRLQKFKKRLLWGGGTFLVIALGGVGAAIYTITRPFDAEFAQQPNAVEAHEANRKLKLLNDAQSAEKRGFVRFSEVEINSFLEGRYNATKEAQTNGPVKLVKSGVLLGSDKITFVTWHEAVIFGMNLPIVWQRAVSPAQTTNGWSFTVASMRVGNLDVPEQYWGHVEKFLGTGDALFEDRKAWLKSLPLVTLGHNELSKSPEFRLYTYVPTEKAKTANPSERNVFPQN
jgi:hypothetical protein